MYGLPSFAFVIHFAFLQLLTTAKGEHVSRYGNKRVASASALAFEGGKVCPVSERVIRWKKKKKKTDFKGI